MKKRIHMFLTAQVVSMSLLVGCGGTAPAQTAETAVVVEETAAVETTVVEETTTAEETETETEEETTEPAPLPYVEEQGLTFSKETSYTIAGIRYDPDNTSDFDVIDVDVEIISAAQEPAEQEGYRTINIKYSMSGEAWQDLGKEKAYNFYMFPAYGIYDIYTGRKIPGADMEGDMSLEYSTELEWEGQTYTVGYTEDAYWEFGDWEEREDGYYAKGTVYTTYIITIPDDYDGLALMQSPQTEYDDDFESGEIDEEESYIMDEWEDGSRLILVSDLLEALGE